MINCFLISLALIFVIILSFVYFELSKLKIPIWMLDISPYSPVEGEGFTGVRVKELVQKPSFYKKYRESTLNYLLSVYPTSKESFESLSDVLLASFYNSLSYYYNCQFEYHQEDLKEEDRWDAMSCKDKYPLPYPPQGWFYNFYTFQKYNTPIVFSDSNINKPYLNLKNFGSCRPGKAFDYTSDKDRAGPGLFWLNCRSLHRDTTFPNGLVVVNSKNRQRWKFSENKEIGWNYPMGWSNGLPNNSFIEVTHTQPVPGLAQSLGWWWNGVAGSGMFLNLGKTMVATNKMDAVYRLLELQSKDFRKKWFGSDDIDEIIFGFAGYCGYNQEKNIHYCDPRYTRCNEHCEPDYLGVLRASNLPISNFYKETLRFQRVKNISKDSKPTKEGIQKAIYFARNNLDYRLSRVSSKIIFDEVMFFLGMNSNIDTIQLPTDPNMNGYFVFEIVDLRMPEKYLQKARNRDYSQFLDLQENPNDNKYKDEAIKDWLEDMIKNEIITSRDPLDIYNKKKVSKCLDVSNLYSDCKGKDKGKWYNFYCSNIPITNEFKCLGMGDDADGKGSCVLKGEGMTC